METTKNHSLGRALASKLIYSALSVLNEKGKELPMRELFAEVEKRVQPEPWARERYEKSGYVRWESILHFYSIHSIKAGYLVKKKGIWYITPEGEEALKKFSPEELLLHARKLYRQWKANRPDVDLEGEEEDEAETVASAEQELSFDEVEQRAREGLERFIDSKNPYEFQDLVAALLRGMGYYTPFVAPKGKDGGLDVIAYRDPLGTQSPRIQVQVKHREKTASAQEVRQLMGLLQKEGDIGIFVSSGGFSPDAKQAARGSHAHVELVDLSRFILLWQEFYEKMSDGDKRQMPLRPVFFLDTREV